MSDQLVKDPEVLPVAPNGHDAVIDSAAAAKKWIDHEKQQRVEACGAALQAIVRQYRCELRWVETHVNGKVEQASLQIVAMD